MKIAINKSLNLTPICSCLFYASICIFIAVPLTTSAKVEFDSSSLLLKNSDQVSEMLKKKIKAAQRLQAKQEDNDEGEIQVEPEALENLKAAMRIALSRPNQPDGARSSLYTQVRRELVDLNSLETVLSELTEEAVDELRKQDGPRRTATYVIILENMMAEIRPEIEDNADLKKIMVRIRDAKIVVLDKIKAKNLLRSMSIPVSPSDTAAKILKNQK